MYLVCRHVVFPFEHKKNGYYNDKFDTIDVQCGKIELVSQNDCLQS